MWQVIVASYFSRPTLISDMYAFIFYTSRNTDSLSVPGNFKANTICFDLPTQRAAGLSENAQGVVLVEEEKLTLDTLA